MKKIKELTGEFHSQNDVKQIDHLKLSAEVNALQRSFALFRQDLSKIIRDELMRINRRSS